MTAAQRADARRRATDILNQILGGADFAWTARDQSEDTDTALSCGLLGTFPRGQMPAAFDAPAFSVKPGEISEPIETPFGFHIIRVDGTLRAQTMLSSQLKPRDKPFCDDERPFRQLWKVSGSWKWS